MPTIHVEPDDAAALQDIAVKLLKSKKIVVVTGAGISTNSGIPDFRSENGLYSLIQAQFDAAARVASQNERADAEPPASPGEDEHGERVGSPVDIGDVERPAKRRKIGRDTLRSSQISTIESERSSSPAPASEKAATAAEIGLPQAESGDLGASMFGRRRGADIYTDGSQKPDSGHDSGGADNHHDNAPSPGRPHDQTAAAPGHVSSHTGARSGDSPTAPTTEFIITSATDASPERPCFPPTAPPLPTLQRRLADTSCNPLLKPLLAAGNPRSSSPLSSPPSSPYLDSRTPRHTPSKASPPGAVLYSSSPLSSPPPVLFDPYRPPSRSESQHELVGGGSTSPSETDETPPFSNSFSASQTSTSSRSALPNIKGRDLFDASIWSCPLRTSVFYTFATTLRQKAKDVEPTESHSFIGHLRDRGKLVRCYTQNIDRIEEKVGLSTSLAEGPGTRGRFSRKSTGEFKLKQEAAAAADAAGAEDAGPDGPRDGPRNESAPLRRGGVDVVYLHGSLDSLRCFQCGRLSPWDDSGREQETLAGCQPECPHCAGATAARQERGKRALGVGKLRPDVVLYGEEHPTSHLISPIVTHDLGVGPDLLLILGTSLKVHGLKVLVREFAKAVHGKGGKVVFVNFTKPPESSWGDVIDYWIEWDCDAWVGSLKGGIPALWQLPGEETKKRRESMLEKAKKQDEPKPPKPPRPPAGRPNALREHKANGAYLTWKIQEELRRISGRTHHASLVPLQETLPQPLSAITVVVPAKGEPEPKAAKPRRTRKSAPAVLGQGRKTKQPAKAALDDKCETPKRTPILPPRTGSAGNPGESSILAAVKSNPRRRKRKTIDGEEVVLPGKRTMKPRPVLEPSPSQPASSPSEALLLSRHPHMASLKLPPLKYLATRHRLPPPKPRSGLPPLEPAPSPHGPLTSISSNIPMSTRRLNPFFLSDPLERYCCAPSPVYKPRALDAAARTREDAAMVLSELRKMGQRT